jgi:hypothetical protein
MSEATLETARKIASRLIALQSASRRFELALQDPDKLNVQVIQQIYQAAVGQIFERVFGIPQAEAYSEDEFIDFYLRHGVVCTNFSNAIFHQL